MFYGRKEGYEEPEQESVGSTLLIPRLVWLVGRFNF
jgi:hypothetical protein